MLDHPFPPAFNLSGNAFALPSHLAYGAFALPPHLFDDTVPMAVERRVQFVFEPGGSREHASII